MIDPITLSLWNVRTVFCVVNIPVHLSCALCNTRELRKRSDAINYASFVRIIAVKSAWAISTRTAATIIPFRPPSIALEFTWFPSCADAYDSRAATIPNCPA